MLNSLEMAREAVRALDAKKGSDIRVLTIGNDGDVVADYFIICTAGSSTQIKTLSDEVQKVLAEQGEEPLHVEGYRSGGWLLVDYGCIVVHLFLKETREFYSLERLWSDAPEVDVSDLITE